MGKFLRNASLAMLAAIAVGCGAGAPDPAGSVGQSISVADLPPVGGCDSLTDKLPAGAMLQRIEGIEDLYVVSDAQKQARCIDTRIGALRVINAGPGGTLERAASNPMPGVDPGSPEDDAASNPMPGVDPAASNPMPGNSGHK